MSFYKNVVSELSGLNDIQYEVFPSESISFPKPCIDKATSQELRILALNSIKRIKQLAEEDSNDSSN